MGTTLGFLAAAALGLTAGALLAEGAVLVPFWRSLAPGAFLGWYRENGNLLLRFYGPLEVAAALLIVLATGAEWLDAGSPPASLAIASLLALLVLGSFPLYFKQANARFAEGTIAPERVPGELRRWARWHWARVAISTAAFLAAILPAAWGRGG